MTYVHTLLKAENFFLKLKHGSTVQTTLCKERFFHQLLLKLLPSRGIITKLICVSLIFYFFTCA